MKTVNDNLRNSGSDLEVHISDIIDGKEEVNFRNPQTDESLTISLAELDVVVKTMKRMGIL